MKLSDKIRILRKARGFSQEGLGNALSRVNQNGISRQTISDWENGNCEPKLDNIRDLASVLNVSFDSLLDENIDLENADTLNAVLKNLSADTKKRINSKFRYRLYSYDITKKHYIRLFVYFSLVLLSVVMLAFIPAILRMDNSFSIIYLIISCVMPVVLISCISLPISTIKEIKNGGSKYGSCFGEINNTHLILNSTNQADNTVYIPIEKIESIEADKKATKEHGPVLIHVKGRARPVTLLDIRKPFELVEFYKKLNEIIEDSDEIKIL